MQIPHETKSIGISKLTCPRCLYHPLCWSDKHRVGRQEGLRRRRPVAQRAVRSDPVVSLPVALRQHTHLQQRIEDLSVQQFVPQLPVETRKPFSHGDPGSI